MKKLLTTVQTPLKTFLLVGKKFGFVRINGTSKKKKKKDKYQRRIGRTVLPSKLPRACVIEQTIETSSLVGTKWYLGDRRTVKVSVHTEPRFSRGQGPD